MAMTQAPVSTTEPMLTDKKKRSKELWGWVRFIAGLAAAYFIMMHVVGLTRVSGESMLPSLSGGNILLVNKWSAYWGQPAYGDVVVVHSPRLSYDIVKRVIAVEGDRVNIEGGTLSVNGEPLVELYTYGVADDMAEVAVGPGEVFVLGDNREPGASLDSRSAELGLVQTGDIKGYALMRLLPFAGIAKPLP